MALGASLEVSQIRESGSSACRTKKPLPARAWAAKAVGQGPSIQNLVATPSVRLYDQRIFLARDIVWWPIEPRFQFDSVSILPRNFLHSRQSKILELRIQIHQQRLPACGRIDGNNPRGYIHALIENDIRQRRRRCLFRGTGSRPCLAALLKVRFWRYLSVDAVNPANVACNIAGLGIPTKKSEVFIANLDELAAGNLEFHQKGMRLSECPFRRIGNIQRKIYIGNNHGLAVGGPGHLRSNNRDWRIEQDLACSCNGVDQLVLQDAGVASIWGGVST